MQKTVTVTNARLKNFSKQKGVSFFDNSCIKEFHFGKRESKQCLCKKFIASYKQDRLIFFPYDLVTVNECLSNTLEKAKSGTNSSLQTIRIISIN